MMGYLSFLLQIFFVAFAAHSAARLHKEEKPIDRLLLFSLYFLGFIIIPMTLLGSLGILTYPVLLGFLVFQAGLLYWIAHTSFPSSLHHSITSSLNHFLYFLPFLIFLFLKFFTSAFSSVIETDSLVYHLPFSVQWFQTGSIWEPYFTAYAGPLGYYPGNYELLSLFSFFPFQNDGFVNLVNFPLFIPFALVLYGLARHFGFSHKQAIFPPFLFLFAPFMLRQAGIPQNDLFFILTLALAAYFFLKARAADSERFQDWLPFAISLGLFIGTKSSGILYGCLFFFMAAWVLRKHLRLLLAVLFFIFLSGGFWYVRNWIFTGNPLFPLHIEVAGITLLQGYNSFIDQFKNSALINHLDVSTFKQVAKNMLLSTGVLSAAAFFAFILGLRHVFAKKLSDRPQLLVLLMLLPITFGLYILTPFSFSNIYPNIRYLLPFFLVSYLIFLAVVSRKSAIIIWIFSLITALFLIIFQKRFLPYVNDWIHIDFRRIFEYPQVTAVLAIFAVLMGLFLWIKGAKKWAVGALCVIIFGIFLSKSSEIRSLRRFDSFVIDNEPIYNAKILEAWEFTDKNLPPDARIAFTRGGAHYPLFGEHWTRRVSYVNINECAECLYDDYKTSPRSILRDPSYENWLRNLERVQKQYLFIGQKEFEKIPAYELDWAAAHPERFGLLFENGYSYLYRINF